LGQTKDYKNGIFCLYAKQAALRSKTRQDYMIWLTIMEYLCHRWPPICSVCTFLSFPLSWLITRLKRRVLLVEQELLTILEFATFFSGIHVVGSVQLHIFMFLVLWCDVCCNFHVKTDVHIVITHIFVRSSCLIYVNIHIGWCLCCLTRRVSLMRLELL